MSADKPHDDLLGKTLGQFEIIEEIGRGGMATVYSARQTSMNRTVAIKVLPRHLMHDPNFYERFEREVDVIAHLEHPHILPIYDYGQSENIPFIAMRYLGGGSMEQMIRRGMADINELERPIRQICQALDYAHKEGIIHRDIKPGNIMLDNGGNAYLSDFGIARVLGSELTGSMIVGTPAYMSPEQANGLSIDGRADIYAMGVVVFELITGREPYEAETPMAVLLKHINEPMPPISNFREGIPDGVQQVVDKATEKDPNDRFSSAGEMSKALGAALRGESMSFASPTQASATPAGNESTRSMDNTKTITGQIMPDNATMPPSQMPIANNTPIPMQAGMADSQTNITGVGIPQKSGPSTSLLVAVVLVVALLVAGGLGALALNNQGDDDEPIIDTSGQTVDVVPTPFFRAETVIGDEYTVSIPEAWIPPTGFLDLSNANRMVHVWQPNDGSAYVALEMLDFGTITDADEMDEDEVFEALLRRYNQEVLNEREATLTEIESVVAPDGTIRRSFRMVGAQDGNREFEPGQLDIFFINRDPFFVALNMYSADSSGNTLVQPFQNILDSLRVSD